MLYWDFVGTDIERALLSRMWWKSLSEKRIATCGDSF